MDVIVRNFNYQATEGQVRAFFRKVLEDLGIHTFHCHKPKGGFAILTIPDTPKARQFLDQHGQKEQGAKGFKTVKVKLYHQRRPINCIKSTQKPDPFLLKSLMKEEHERYVAAKSKKLVIVPPVSKASQKKQRAFGILQLSCGQWDYVDNDLVFVPYFTDRRNGRLLFGSRSVYIKLEDQQMEFFYSSIRSFTVGSSLNPSITMQLSEAPRMFKAAAPSPVHTPVDQTVENLSSALQALILQKPKAAAKRSRITALNHAHQVVVGSCLCYRFLLLDPSDASAVKALKSFPEIPDITSCNTAVVLKTAFAGQMTDLNTGLTGSKYNAFSFDLKYQLQKLAQNGYLAPSKVVQLLPIVKGQWEGTGKKHSAVVGSIRQLFTQLPYPGPNAEAWEFSLDTLRDFLNDNYDSILRGESYTEDLAEGYDHITSVYKVTVTPAGTYLYGPEPEVKNRVLRKYAAYPNHFISVSFLDENGEPLRLDRATSGEEIYYGRYKKVLEGIINIAGRGYEVLGWSHSSLRDHTAWFMAPFTLDNSLIYARMVIKDLGDFSAILSPAKCAARIGQAFSQTLSSIAIPQGALKIMPDIQRNGRTFSDGVGTCSSAVVNKINAGYMKAARGLKPTVFQVRFQGAKGVVSLDTRLQGEALYLRPSMIKFEVTDATIADIEVCGSARKPLSMYLNRQMIKILEDLGVPDKAFLDLQASAVEQLRMTTLSAINASTFLQRNKIGEPARLPWLFRKLWALGLSFTEDRFLSNTLETAVLVQLRELKHRTRILVEQGETLYGIMDETGYLKEGQVYCSVHTEERGYVVMGKAVITRSPALHPGDIQCVEAVDVPYGSPLRDLHNIIVFSSKGDRDLPSMLSGGDLDGDLYNLIYDHRLYPQRVFDPADYPTPTAIDIGRTVTRNDMTDFFVDFMINDKLGLIATVHQILADQKPCGVLDPQCILLAEMHSTAVDFSKTGIPVNFAIMPKYPSTRPDFQAPGPRVLIDESIRFIDEETPDIDEEDDELAEIASFNPPKLRYYESNKILGKLYREIDEKQFLEQIQVRSLPTTQTDQNLLDIIWKYVNVKAVLIQWNHLIDFARSVQDNYEENLAETMLSFSTHSAHVVSEVEVFAGNILGKTGAASKRQRDFAMTMKEQHDQTVAYTVAWMTRGDDHDSRGEALERSIACLYVACNFVRVRRRVGALMSFGWIAAAVCLREIEKLPNADVLL